MEELKPEYIAVVSSFTECSIRKKTLEYMNGYIDTAELKDIDNYIVPAGLGGEQGIKGALYLAKQSSVLTKS